MTINAQLLTRLFRSNTSLGSSPARERSLDLLAKGAKAVVTGQQCGLFGGPLFTLYKAFSAIEYAASISTAENPVVPIFWVASEDHDFDEIAVWHGFTTGGGLTNLRVASRAEENFRWPIKQRSFSEQIQITKDSLRGHLGIFPHASRLLDKLDAQYQPNQNIAAAFTALMAEAFAHTELLFLEPELVGVSDFTRPLLQRTLVDYEQFDNALKEREKELESDSRALQVRLIEDSTLFFFQVRPGDPTRYRLRRQAELWYPITNSNDVADRVEANVSANGFTTDELLYLIEAAPERFTSSALLRPLVQDALLPTIAYIGGAAELAYHRQITPLYQILNIKQPQIIERFHATVVDHRTQQLLKQLNWSVEEVLAGIEPPLPQVVTDRGEVVRNKIIVEVDNLISPIIELVQISDRGLDKAASLTRERAIALFSDLLAKVERLTNEKVSFRAERINRVRERILPLGKPQERVIGWLYFAARFGEELFTKVQESAGRWALAVINNAPIKEEVLLMEGSMESSMGSNSESAKEN